MTSPRRRARERAMQGVYEWLVAGNPAAAIERRILEEDGIERLDSSLLFELLRGTIEHAPALEARLAPLLDRPVAQLSPVERAVLLVAAFELAHRIETPYRVVLNEAVEIAKLFGGTDGHKFVNGVLDRLALELRTLEARARDRAGAPTAG